MTDLPFASIVVPVFNGSDTIDDLLQSLMALNYPRGRYEIIVVDNNSRDNTPQRVQQYPVKLLYEHQIQSSYAARNRGVKAAKGEIIVFTDADCVAHPGWLRHLLADYADHRWGGFAGRIEACQPCTDVQRHLTNIGWFTLPLSQWQFSVPQSRGELLCSHLKILDYRSDISLPSDLVNPPTANVAYRQQVFDEIGYFDPRLTSGGDMDFAWHVQTQTDWQIKVIPEAIIYHSHRRNLAGMAKQYRSYGWGHSLLALKYGSNPHRVARQVGIESLLLIGLSVANQSLNFCVRLLRSLLQRPSDDLYLKLPIFNVVGSVNYYYGRLTGARKGNQWLSQNSIEET
ncbi:MAG: glycosyltransferase [Candidatus Hodarchaeota archaeon]